MINEYFNYIPRMIIWWVKCNAGRGKKCVSVLDNTVGQRMQLRKGLTRVEEVSSVIAGKTEGVRAAKAERGYGKGMCWGTRESCKSSIFQY